MKYKISMVILSVIAVIACALTLAACVISHQHIYSTKIIAPSCTEQGYTLHTCSCGDNYKDTYTNALGHKEIQHKGQAATCSVKGWQDYVTCARCNYSTYKEINLQEHSIVIDNAIPASCTSTGLSEGKHCFVCGIIIVEQKVTNMIAHTYGDWYQIKASSCFEKGSKRRDCLKCNNYEDSEIATLSHTEVVDDAVPATCSSTGLTEGKHCSVCNTVIIAQVPTNKVNHIYGDWKEIKSATCVETGTERRDCINCDAFEMQSKGLLAPHTEVIDKAVPATCSSTGLTEGKHCSVCGYISKAQEVIEAQGHVEITDNAVRPTCTETGLTEGTHCWRCNEIIVSQNVVPATGHTKYILMEAVMPTCTLEGYTEWSYCDNCLIDLSERQAIAALGHKEVADVAVLPTCENPGLTEGKHCTVCGAITIRQTKIEALGHNWSCSNYDKEKHTAYCNICNENVVNEKHRWRDNDCSVCDYDEGGTKGLTYQLNSAGTEYSLIRGKNLKDIIIPETYNNLPVTFINDDAFDGCNTIERMVLPFVGTTRGAVTGRASMFGSIFGGTLSSSDTLQFWTEEYFKEGTADRTYCKVPKSLKTVMITQGSIRFGAFSNCENIESIVLGDKVLVVERYAFYGCKRLKNIEMSYCVGNVKLNSYLQGWEYSEQPFGYAFGERQYNGSYETTQQDKTYYIPQTLNSINITAGKVPLQAFCGFSSLQNVVIGNEVTTIGTSAFRDCIFLTDINMGTGILSVGNAAFADCSSLNSVRICDLAIWCGITFNDSSTSNPLYYAKNFYLNDKLISDLVIPNTVKEIKAGAFQSFNGKTITIPSSVTRIEMNAFFHCTNVTKIIFESPNNWKAGTVSITSTELADAEIAARYLINTYNTRIWSCDKKVETKNENSSNIQ